MKLTFETPFDTYKASKILGEGGAGRVYHVSNDHDEEFALKVLLPEWITRQRLKRFKNEINFCQRCDHRNIVKVVDTGATIIKNVKCPFYVMKHYPGTLRTAMDSLARQQAMTMFAQILDGVEAAHLLKVWHRDLKPENVLYDDRESRVAVTDFGIAHFDEDAILTAVKTRNAERLANFQYSAPEQRRKGAQVDYRADIFALGLMLNELFTKEVLQGEGYRKIGDVSADHAYLDHLVARMVHQDPASRPASIDEIKQELIARKNEFVARQKYDEAKSQVVNLTSLPVFEGITITNFDYDAGENGQGTLSLKLSRCPPDAWVTAFRNPNVRHTVMSGYGPERFEFRNDSSWIDGVRSEEHHIQSLLNNAKEYVSAANRAYLNQIQSEAIHAASRNRKELENQLRNAELKKNILSKVRLN